MPGVTFDDEYKDGVLIKRTQRIVPDSDLRATAAAARLISSRARLQQIRDVANANSGGGAFANLAAASAAIRAIAGGMADLAQNILDLELIAAYQQDNGSD